MSKLFFSLRVLPALAGVALLVTGCGREKISVYEIPKEAEPAATAGAANPHGGGMAATAPAAMPRLKWGKLPAGWEENPAPGAMRAASFLVKGEGDNVAELAAIPMSGMEGMELQLVNMWRGQVKLDAVSEPEAAKQSLATTIGGEAGKLYEMASTEPVIDATRRGRIVVAVLKRPDTTWFFKLAGEDTLVAQAKPALLELLKTVEFLPAEAAPAAELPAGHPPMDGAPMAGGGAGAMRRMGGGDNIPPGTGERPQWAVPASWTEVARSQFLVAKFRATGEGDAKADINVSKSGGTGGGLLMNVNRWRGQLGLGALDEAGLAKASAEFVAGKARGTLIDFVGNEAENNTPSRCIAVTVPQPHETWFYKLMGPAALVEREREAFLNFVRNVQYPDDGHAH